MFCASSGTGCRCTICQLSRQSVIHQFYGFYRWLTVLLQWAGILKPTPQSPLRFFNPTPTTKHQQKWPPPLPFLRSYWKRPRVSVRPWSTRLIPHSDPWVHCFTDSHSLNTTKQGIDSRGVERGNTMRHRRRTRTRMRFDEIGSFGEVFEIWKCIRHFSNVTPVWSVPQQGPWNW